VNRLGTDAIGKYHSSTEPKSGRRPGQLPRPPTNDGIRLGWCRSNRVEWRRSNPVATARGSVVEWCRSSPVATARGSVVEWCRRNPVATARGSVVEWCRRNPVANARGFAVEWCRTNPVATAPGSVIEWRRLFRRKPHRYSPLVTLAPLCYLR